MPEQPCCWGRGWCKTQNARKTRPRPRFWDQKAVSHVVWTQIPLWPSVRIVTVSTGSLNNLPSRFVSPKLGLKKWRGNGFNAQALKCLQSSVSKFSYCVQMCACILRFQSVLASVFDANCCALVLSSMSYDRKMNSVFTCIF